MSFDYCSMGPEAPNSFMCIFNDRSVLSDEILVNFETGAECTHYSKVVEKFDIATVDTLYSLIEEVALRNRNERLVLRTYHNKEIIFPEINVYRTIEFETGKTEEADQLSN